MSGTPKLKPPRNNAEWARNTEKRQGAVEHPTSQRIGRWVLSEDAETGALIASHVDGGSIVLAVPPDASAEADPDAIAATDLLSVTLTRTAAQAVPGGGATVLWDGVIVDVGDWVSGGGQTSIESVVIPADGVYLLTTTVHFSAGSASLSAAIVIDGVSSIIGRIVESSGIVYPSVYAIGQLTLPAGAAISVFTGAGGVARNIGGSGLVSPPAPSTLTISMVSRG